MISRNYRASASYVTGTHAVKVGSRSCTSGGSARGAEQPGLAVPAQHARLPGSGDRMRPALPAHAVRDAEPDPGKSPLQHGDLRAGSVDHAAPDDELWRPARFPECHGRGAEPRRRVCSCQPATSRRCGTFRTGRMSIRDSAWPTTCRERQDGRQGQHRPLRDRAGYGISGPANPVQLVGEQHDEDVGRSSRRHLHRHASIRSTTAISPIPPRIASAPAR